MGAFTYARNYHFIRNEKNLISDYVRPHPEPPKHELYETITRARNGRFYCPTIKAIFREFSAGKTV